MSAASAKDISALREKYESAGQGQVYAFWDQLSAEEQAALHNQLATIDPVRVNNIFKTATNAESSTEPSASLSPPPPSSQDSVIGHDDKAGEWNALGLAAIKAGQVGVLLMAGGQGTRLGSSAPKGCYDIGLPSHKSLFQLQAERIKGLEKVAGGAVVPWYIMTSGPTRKPTEDFFKANDYFGLEKENVVFFEQGVLPCLTNDGKFFLDTKSSVAVAPDGNGGLYAALRAPLSPSLPASSVLSDLASRGVKFLHAYCVDNCLVRVADPVFLGYAIQKGADCGAKVVRKTDPAEAVGVVALRGGHFGVVEYSEIPRALSEARDGSGELAYRAANIANHFYTLDFLTSVASFEHEMAFHIARKKIPHVDLASGAVVKPAAPNGMKLELFVFDVFPFTRAFALLEVGRAADFSPLKNAPGTGADDPGTSRRDLLAAFKAWLGAAGAEVAEGVEVEISPLVSYAGEGLEAVKGKTFVRSGVAESVEDLLALAA